VEKKYKILLYTFIGLAVLLGVVYFANKIVKQKIKAGIEQELLNSNVEYKDISVDIISGSSVVSSPKLKLGSATISSEELSVIDLDYKEYFSNNKIVFDRIVFKKPKIHITQSDTLKDPDKENSKKDFKEEYRAILKKYNVDYDERYVWD
jgi:hypothetical protein